MKMKQHKYISCNSPSLHRRLSPWSFLFTAIILESSTLSEAYIDFSTVGQPWPMPISYVTTAETVAVDADNFQFQSVGGVQCDILTAAYERYRDLTFGGYR